jgi:hypothetical protein
VNDPSSALLYLQIAIALAGTVCCAALIRKALSFHEKRWIAAAIFLVGTAVLSLLSVHIPLFFLSESERVQHHLTTDIMMFGSAGLILIAIIGFAIDHISERPNWLMVAAAACMSTGLFPFVYRFNQESLNQQYRIKIVEQDQPKNTLESILEATPQSTTGNDSTEENAPETSNSN